MGASVGLDGCGKSRPTGIRSPDRPACIESLNRLSYPGRRLFLGAFAELRKTISLLDLSFLCVCVCFSAWNNSVPIRRILLTFVIDNFYKNLSVKYNFD